MFQSYALFPNMTVNQNIAYGLENKKLSKREIQIKVNEALELVNLQPHANKYPQEISGGQQQRVALARAIVLEPEFLLLDEPLSALDAKVRQKLRKEIKNLQQKPVPMSLPAVLEIIIYFFVNSMVTVSAIVFLYPSNFKLAAIAIVNMEDAGDIAPAAALSVLIIVTNIFARLLYEIVSFHLNNKNFLRRSNENE